jgi:hypothetical protein
MMVAWHETPGNWLDAVRPLGNGLALSIIRDKGAPCPNRSYCTLRDGLLDARFPGILCQATIILSLRDKSLALSPRRRIARSPVRLPVPE